MKSHTAQSATSLPRAPRDEASSRLVKYAITMSIRTVCFILMAVVQPFGWWTWAFAVGAIFLPYVAVVFANVGEDEHEVRAIPPERALAQPTTEPETTVVTNVIRIQESSSPSAAAQPARETPDDSPELPEERTR